MCVSRRTAVFCGTTVVTISKKVYMKTYSKSLCITAVTFSFCDRFSTIPKQSVIILSHNISLSFNVFLIRIVLFKTQLSGMYNKIGKQCRNGQGEYKKYE